MSDPFRFRGYRLDPGRLQLAVLAATVPSVLWVLTDLAGGDRPYVPVVLVIWLFLLGLFIALSVERESEDWDE